MRRLLSLLLMFPFFLSAQQLPPAPHAADFGNALGEPHRVTGRIVNMPTGWSDQTVGYSTVEFSNEGQVRNTTEVAADGSFSFEIANSLPAVEVWFWHDSMYFGALWMTGDLDIELNYTERKLLGEQPWHVGGVKFSGPSAEVTRLRNEMIHHVKSEAESTEIALMDVQMNRKLSPVEKTAQLDSLYAELWKVEDEFLRDKPERFVTLWRAERESDYLGLLMVQYWNKNDAPAAFHDRVLQHNPIMVSNATQSFYRHYNILLKKEEWRAAYRDTIGTVPERYGRHIARYVARLDSMFPPARADVYKLFFDHGNLKANLAMYEAALPTVRTAWVRTILLRETERLRAKAAEMDAVLAKSVGMTDPADLGEAHGHLEFGADLYVTDPALTGEELLEKIRGAFAGKSIYLDFWAVWCSPCIGEMPHSAKLHGEAEGLPVEFVYLCTASGGDPSSWQDLIAEHKVGGTHLYVSKKTHAELMDIFNGSGYPTYVLLNAEGQADLGVERPSGLNRKKLAKLLKREKGKREKR